MLLTLFKTGVSVNKTLKLDSLLYITGKIVLTVIKHPPDKVQQ
jgi:hypothetical protein